MNDEKLEFEKLTRRVEREDGLIWLCQATQRPIGGIVITPTHHLAQSSFITLEMEPNGKRQKFNVDEIYPYLYKHVYLGYDDKPEYRPENKNLTGKVKQVKIGNKAAIERQKLIFGTGYPHDKENQS